MGIVGGALGYHLLRRISREGAAADHAPGQMFPWQSAAYAGRSKLEVLFGPGIWAQVAGKVVMARSRATIMGNHDFAVFYEPYNFNAGAEQA